MNRLGLITLILGLAVAAVGCSGLVASNNAPPVAPSITTQPAGQTVSAGQTASFSVAVTGSAPLSYQWHKNGVLISAATSSTYATPAATSSDNGAQFTVLVSNMAGSANSNAATLTVNAAPVAPSITTQPASQTVSAGQTASFNVAATCTAPLSYQWNRNGTAISGATSSSYTIPVTTSADSGAQFTVVVTNIAGSVTSSAATLTVNPAPLAPSITTQPTSQTVTAGQSATFNVTAIGAAPLSYQWKRNGVAISGATSSSYTTAATASSDNGAQFTVVVTNTAGSVTSSPAILTVNVAPVAPSITTQPASQTVTAGQTATFTVAATGTAPMSYQWQKNTVAIGGATSSSYTTPATTSADNGAQFTVVVTNTAGSVTSSAATLTISPVARVVVNVTTFGATGNGTTDDTIAIDNATAALQAGYSLYFPCGTYRVTSTLTPITKDNIEVDGQIGCAGGQVTINGTGGLFTILQVGSGGLSAPTPLTAAATELSTTFSASFANIGGLNAGDYVLLQEGGKDFSTDVPPGNDKGCDVAGCRGED